jgi:hypothetical protein
MTSMETRAAAPGMTLAALGGANTATWNHEETST